MSGEFDSTKPEQRAQIFVKLSFRELYDSKLSGLHLVDNMLIIHWIKIAQRQKGRLWVHETPTLEVIFITLTENSSAVTNYYHGPQK